MAIGSRGSSTAASVLLVAQDDRQRLERQLVSLIEADLGDGVEFVVVDDAAAPDVRQLLAALAGDVTIVRNDAREGRAAALRSAAAVATGDVVIALGAGTLVRPGFLAPLVDAVRAGAGLAAPVIETAAGDVHGYTLAADGTPWPRAAEETPPLAAVALDCFAARPATLATLPVFTPRDGLYEAALAAHGTSVGPLLVAGSARVVRTAGEAALSIVICCRNRAAEVEENVRLCLAHGLLAGATEVLVVDNGSTDDTAARIAALATAQPGIVRCVHEPVPGLSRARQAGAAAAAYPNVAYLDDDARPAPGWLEALRHALDDPTVAIAGGPITGLWTDGAPATTVLPVELEGFVGILDRGDGDRETDPGDCPWGGNYAIRRAALQAVGGFDPRLGLSADARIGGEEIDVSRRVRAAGLGRSVYVADAAVGHRVGARRVTPGALLARAFSSGVELVRHERLAGTMSDAVLARTVAVAVADLAAVTALPPGLLADEVLAHVAAVEAPVLARFRVSYGLGSVAAAARDGAVDTIAGIRFTPAHGAGIVAVPAPRQVAA